MKEPPIDINLYRKCLEVERIAKLPKARIIKIMRQLPTMEAVKLMNDLIGFWGAFSSDHTMFLILLAGE